MKNGADESVHPLTSLTQISDTTCPPHPVRSPYCSHPICHTHMSGREGGRDGGRVGGETWTFPTRLSLLLSLLQSGSLPLRREFPFQVIIFIKFQQSTHLSEYYIKRV